MTRHMLIAAATLALLVAGCSRGNADKGLPSEQQRSDLDNAQALVDNTQTVELPDDSLTAVNESNAQATLNAAVPGAAPAPDDGAAATGNSVNRVAPR